MELSIIIVTYNSAKYINACLNSLITHLSTIKYQIIIVDNNSQDNTVQLIQENFPQVSLLLNNRNLGFAKANNQAIRTADGEYLLMINDDTLVINNAIEKLLAYFKEQPKIGLLGPKLLNADFTIQAQGSLFSKHFWESSSPVKTAFLKGAVLLTKKAVLANVGLFDESFFFYGEDLELARRIRRAGYQIVYYPNAEVVHYGGKMTLVKYLMGLKSSWYLWRSFWFKKGGNNDKKYS